MGIKTEPNEVRFDGDIAVLSTNGKYTVEFKIDKEDYERIMEYRWHLNPNGYIQANGKERRMSKSGKYYIPKVYLHRFIIGAKTPQVDHINRNKLDNRKCNLRGVTHTQNFGNRAPHRTYRGKPVSSRYKGVGQTSSGSWKAEICKEGVHYRLGRFLTEVEAAQAYNKKALELYGEYARINNI